MESAGPLFDGDAAGELLGVLEGVLLIDTEGGA